MKVRSVLLVFSLALGLVNHSEAQSRRDLKKMCKQVRKDCRSNGGSRKSCRKKWKKCRKENGVRFVDDLKFGLSKIKAALGKVELKISEDEEGDEFIALQVSSKTFKKVGSIELSHEDLKSNASVSPSEVNEDEGVLSLEVYDSDFENDVAEFEDLSTSEGRAFPKFLNGEKFESLRGIQIKKSQVYLDDEKGIIGIFIPAEVSGKLVDWLNQLKEKIPIINNLPNINSIPVTIKIKDKEDVRHKIGRFYVLSKDESGENAGVILLFDKVKIKDLKDQLD